MAYVYVTSESDHFGNNLYTVGFYNPDGEFVPESDHKSADEAARRVAWLNGANMRPMPDLKYLSRD